MTDGFPTRPKLIAILNTAMEELERACTTMSDALRESNDPSMQTFFTELIFRIQKIVANYRDDITRNIATDLANALSALRRLRVPDIDPCFGTPTLALKALRYGRGNLTEALNYALESAASLKLAPKESELPTIAIMRDDVALQIARLDERLRVVEESVDDLRAEVLGDQSTSPSAIAQTKALNYHVETIEDQARAARFETRVGSDPSIPRNTDFAVLNRAISVMVEVATDLKWAVVGLGGKLSEAVRVSGRSLYMSTQRARLGFRAVVRTLKRNLTVSAETSLEQNPTASVLSNPLPDFDIEKVHEMILAGHAPPSFWTPRIEELNFRDTHLEDLRPLSGLSFLRTLNLQNTLINDVSPLSELSKLEVLDLRGTKVSDIGPLFGLSALQSLELSRTLVSDIGPLSGLVCLETLVLWDTSVSNLSALSELKALRSLNLWNTRVSELPALSGLRQMEKLYIGSTKIRDISALSGLLALQQLDLSHTPVWNLTPLSRLTSLETLKLESAPVSDVSPLSKLSVLKTLDLRGTRVSDVSPLAKLTALRWLDLSNTNVTNIAALEGVEKLITVFVDKRNQDYISSTHRDGKRIVKVRP